MKSITVTLLLALAIGAQAENWAVLVAGSNGFWNYRHQADICHAYQILLKNGYNPENIITMAYDDVASSSQNPFKGKLFNKPTGNEPGVDVYAGCVIDYKGNDVTPQNFLAVLRGDSAAVGGKKVLKSTKADKVFINFSDHGAPGLIAFPSSYLYAKDLHPTFDVMQQKGLYEKVVFYLEACESGSMFEDLKTNTGIYGLSAANPHESSWGSYCPPDDKVGGKSIGSCLGDLFSVNWMEDTETGDLQRSLNEHFARIRDLTTQSQVMQWGDLTFLEEPIANYLSHKKASDAASGFLADLKEYLFAQERQESTYWDSRDNKLLYLINKFKNSQSDEDFEALQEEYYERKYFDQKFATIKQAMQLTGNYSKSVDNSCLEAHVDQFENSCRKLSDYGLKYVKYLAEMCDTTNMLLNHKLDYINLVCSN